MLHLAKPVEAPAQTRLSASAYTSAHDAELLRRIRTFGHGHADVPSLLPQVDRASSVAAILDTAEGLIAPVDGFLSITHIRSCTRSHHRPCLLFQVDRGGRVAWFMDILEGLITPVDACFVCKPNCSGTCSRQPRACCSRWTAAGRSQHFWTQRRA